MQSWQVGTSVHLTSLKQSPTSELAETYLWNDWFLAVYKGAWDPGYEHLYTEMSSSPNSQPAFQIGI